MDSISLAALRSALELGYTHIDTAEMYAAGHTEELIGQVIREMRIKRESLFITSKVMPDILHTIRSCIPVKPVCAACRWITLTFILSIGPPSA